MTQIVLMTAVGILTVVLALAGVQIIRILKELKITVEKVNKMLGDMGRVTENIAKPTSPLNNLFFGVKAGLRVLKVLLKRSKKKENE